MQTRPDNRLERGITFPASLNSHTFNKHSLRVATTLLWALATGTILVTPLHAAELRTDQAKVVEAMRPTYIVATNDDLAGFHTVAAPDFYAFDNGKRFTGDALMELMKTLHATGSGQT
jgi:hypothetical protein